MRIVYMGDTPVFKTLHSRPRIIKVDKNTIHLNKFSRDATKSIAIIEDPKNIIDIEYGIVCKEYYYDNSNQPHHSCGTYDKTMWLHVNTSTKQKNGDPFYRLDPVRAYSLLDKDFLSSFLFRTLFTYDSSGKLIPDLSENNGISSENYTFWSFSIKRNCFFDNGNKIKPSDIAYGISRRFAITDILNLNFESPYYPFFLLNISKDNSQILYKGPYDRTSGYVYRQTLFNNAVNYDDENYTITFSLKKPVIDFRDMLTWFAFGTPVPVGSGLPDGSDIDFEPVSSGPYTISKSLSTSYLTINDKTFTDSESKPKRYSKLVLEKNIWWNGDNIRSGKNYQNLIQINFGQDPICLQKMIIDKTNNNSIILDSVPQSIFNSDGMPTNSYKDTALNYNNGFVNYLGINCKLITSKEIRQAIYYVIDINSFIDAKSKAKGINNPKLFASQCDVPISTWQYDYVPTPLKKRPNLDLAKNLMNIAQSKDPVCYNKVTSSQGIYLTLPSMNANEQQFIQSWINNFAFIGIKLNVTFVNNYYSEVLNKEKNEQLTELTYFTWTPDWDNASNVFMPIFVNDNESPIHLLVNQHEPRYQEFLTLLNNTAIIENQHDRKIEWQKVQDFIMEEMWVIPFSVTNHQIAVGSNVRGIKQKFQTIVYSDIYIVN